MKINTLHSVMVLVSVAYLSCGCSNFEMPFTSDEEKEGEVVARVYGSYLYQRDIEGIVPEGTAPEDSSSLISNFISVWAKEQLLIAKAEYNLTASTKDFKKQIDAYRNDLLTFTYKQEYVTQRLDTNVKASEIQRYYEEHMDNFLLKQNIVRVEYMIISNEAPQLTKAISWFKSDDKKDRLPLKNYAQKYAREFSLSDTSWISFDVLTSKIPIETYNQVEFLNRNRIVELKQNGLVYLLRIKAFKIADSNSPLPFVRNIIRNIILNQRKSALLDDLEKKLLEDALSNNEFETF